MRYITTFVAIALLGLSGGLSDTLTAQQRVGEPIEFLDRLYQNAAEALMLTVLDPGPGARIAYGLPSFDFDSDNFIFQSGLYAVVALDGTLLHSELGTAAYVGVGAKVVSLGDVTGDGKDDFSVDTNARTVVLDGQSFALLATLSNPTRHFQPLGDLDGDGVGDVYAFGNGILFGPHWTVPGIPPEHPLSSARYRYPSWYSTGPLAFYIGDISRVKPFVDRNGDGVAEYLVSWNWNDTDWWHFAQFDNLVGLHDGVTGELLDYVRVDRAWSQIGISFDTLGDLSGDGVPEIVVSKWQLEIPITPHRYQIYIADGASLEIVGQLKRFRGHPELDSSEVRVIGKTLRAIGDINKNGSPDFLTAIVLPDPHPDGGIWKIEKVLAVDGYTLEPIWEYIDLEAGGGFSNVVEPAGDVDGDGFQEFVAAGVYKFGVYSCLPAGIRVGGEGTPALDGRVPAIGVGTNVSVSRKKLAFHLTDVPLGRSAHLMLSTQKSMQTVAGGGRVLVPELMLPATSEAMGPFVNATVELTSSGWTNAIGQVFYAQWVMPETTGTGSLHFAASQVFEVTVRP
ncbi:MAG: hypothetical protein WD226_04100 [Planctomycetota bacterium]